MAEIALHATVGADNSPMWKWAKEAREIFQQIEDLRIVIHDGMWRNPNTR